MIYGYDAATLTESGLKQMREVSVSASPSALRALAAFLNAAADELESDRKSLNWHKHLPSSLRKQLGCDLIVLRGDGV